MVQGGALVRNRDLLVEISPISLGFMVDIITELLNGTPHLNDHPSLSQSASGLTKILSWKAIPFGE